MVSDKLKEILTERLAERIEKINTRVLKKIVKDIDELGKLTPTDAQKTANILKYGGDFNALVKEIEKATNLNKKEIIKILDEVAKKNYINAKEYYTIKQLGYLPYEQNLELKQQVEIIKAMTNETFNNLSNTSAIGFTVKDSKGLVKFKDISTMYYEAIDDAVLTITQGKENFSDVVKRIIKELGGSGLKTVDFESGRSMRLDSATRMAVQGAIRDMQNEVQLEIGRQTNCDGIEVSVHAFPAIDHEEIQGHQFRLEEYNKMLNDEEFKDVNGKEYPVTPRHIGMWNCYHNIFSITVGISKPLYTQEELDEIIRQNRVKTEIDGKEYTKYECTQLQRKLETEIRKQKDIQIMGREVNDQEIINEAQGKINKLTNKYNELSKKANIPTQKQRMQVSGYRKVKITDIKNNLPKDIAIHYGDLGTARDTTYFSINSSRRSTGHYGTGTYFISEQEDKIMQDSSYFSRADRPRKEIDFNEYELYKPLIESEADRLHSGLKAINYNEYDSYDFRFMKDDLIRHGISNDKIENAINKAEQVRKLYIEKNYDSDYEAKHDSIATIFMKELGYNGIDVRGLEGFDNTTYGSVIYDLKKKRRKNK